MTHPVPGTAAPSLDLPLTIQARFELSTQTPEHFTMLVFYRGSHCPLCKMQLEELGSRLNEFTDRGISPFAISMDDEERAMKVDAEWDTGNLPLAYDMSEEKAREWGLYISTAREGSEEPAIFSEPGICLVRPDGTLYMAQHQSVPFARPSFDGILKGLDFVQIEDYPPRGTKA